METVSRTRTSMPIAAIHHHRHTVEELAHPYRAPAATSRSKKKVAPTTEPTVMVSPVFVGSGRVACRAASDAAGSPNCFVRTGFDMAGTLGEPFGDYLVEAEESDNVGRGRPVSDQLL